MSPEEALARLLETAFPTPGELLEFLQEQPDGRKLAAELHPHVANRPALYGGAARWLKWTVNRGLFDALASARPSQRPAIATVAAAFGVTLLPVAAPQAPSPVEREGERRAPDKPRPPQHANPAYTPIPPERALADLLASLFKADDLRRWFYTFDWGRDLDLALPPSPSSSWELFHQTALALQGRGYADKRLFRALRDARPGRAADIEAAASAAGAPIGPASTPRPKMAHPRLLGLVDQLRAVEAERDAALVAGQDTAALDAHRLDLKRRIRQGPKLRPGEVLGDGRYQLLEVAGSGGFGTVWRAFDSRKRRVVAVKVLHGHHLEEGSRRERFERGARKMADLIHPGIVRVLDDPGEEDGFQFFVMEYLPGGDLHRAILRRQMPAARALDVILQVGEALAWAHDRGVVHRDVSPHNILLAADGSPRITDFDLVKAADSTGGTKTGAMGKFLYAAPEIMTRPQDADARADVYGLGMTAVFAILGAELPMDVLYGRQAFFAGLGCSEAVREVIGRATAVAIGDRTADVRSFCEAVAEALPPRKPASSDDFGTLDDPPTGRLSGDEVVALAGVAPLRLVGLTGGELTMGSRDGEEGSFDDERPAHRVWISPLYVATTPVTQAQWSAVMKTDPSHFKGADRPVEQVSWYDAVQFCNALSERERRRPAYTLTKGGGEHPDVSLNPAADGFRLPTEAEWEFFCRAGTTTRYWSGDAEADLARVGWYEENSGGQTHPVGEKKAPNPWGLHDVHGNVWEWCWDSKAPYSAEPAADPAAPRGDGRVIRGGCCRNSALRSRSAFRFVRYPWYRYLILGFRLVVPGRPSEP